MSKMKEYVNSHLKKMSAFRQSFGGEPARHENISEEEQELKSKAHDQHFTFKRDISPKLG